MNNKEEAIIERYEKHQIEVIEQLMNNNAKLLQGLDRMRSYIESPKFKYNATVNKDEMLLFISEIKQEYFKGDMK